MAEIITNAIYALWTICKASYQESLHIHYGVVISDYGAACCRTSRFGNQRLKVVTDVSMERLS